MRLTRRALVQGVMLAAASAAARADVASPEGTRVAPAGALLVYDSRLPQSRALLDVHAGEAIDLALEHAQRWSTLRTLRPRGPIIGLTRWTDLVQARALFEPQGLRLRMTQRRGVLFYWEIS